MKDLRPYVCTYEMCDEGDQLYDSFKQWANHEITTHGATLSCPEHVGMGFKSLRDYQEHRIEEHPSTSISTTLPSTAVQGLRRCPICFDQEADFKHIGAHLQRIALFSLPRSTGLEVQSEGGSGNSMPANSEVRASQDSIQGSLPSFEDEDGPDNAQNFINDPKLGVAKLALTAEAIDKIGEKSRLSESFVISDFIRTTEESGYVDLETPQNLTRPSRALSPIPVFNHGSVIAEEAESSTRARVLEKGKETLDALRKSRVDAIGPSDLEQPVVS